MRRFGRSLGRGLLGLALTAAGLWGFGPYEEVDLGASFDARKFGEGVEVYFESVESRFKDITPGVEKRVVWAGQAETRTPVSVLYIHGFSATSEEIRPVPDRVAQALGANLVFTRLTGHGRSGAAMLDGSPKAWMQDTAEALAAAAQVGELVVVIANSTGATLAAVAALDAELSKTIDAMVLMSPNFGLNTVFAPLLTWPAARYWLPPLAGQEIELPVRSEEYGRFWTTRYPSAAVMPLAALLKTVRGMDFSRTGVPVLFWYSDGDKVVRPDLTAGIAAQWGGTVTVHLVPPGLADDAHGHVLAGDVVSPSQTQATVDGILNWLKTQGLE
ncbi:alpha/beta hydrolase [Leisingera daeponensis]|uniref:alpha/beta hydrolase n=1 Tax=Leisingera daeponensis TaxID=405746 RepID=UPI001C959F36|nr:alpha/beta fold hydrolase [Leisingera daeponensis]MBY6055602.1 alpha/beta fold hydrolase [Leisingera daeponensis]